MRIELWRLPHATVLLLLASLGNIPVAHTHAFPKQTTTVEHRPLHVVAWPPLPTAAPISPAKFTELRRRQDDNTVCGFIGGDPQLPATCLAGSHCVLDDEHGAVGCCPNGVETCTTGVFTGCVDLNSPPQTEVNPYVYTCDGANVCYKNVFENGYYQYGCGTASSLATTVAALASGLSSSLSIASLSVTFTATATTLSAPTTIDASFVFSTRTHTSSKTTASSTSTSSTASRTSESPTSSSDPVNQSSASPSNTPVVNHTGAIIGGTISGIAILIALAAIAVYCWRRRRGNVRRGPGGRGSTQYISPMTGGPQGFAPLHSSHDGYETGLPPNMNNPNPTGGAYGQPYPPSLPYHDYNAQAMHQTPAGTSAYQYPGIHPALYGAGTAMGAAGAAPAAEEADSVPLTREIDDFSHGYRSALSRIGEEDEYPSASSSNRSAPGVLGDGPAASTVGGSTAVAEEDAAGEDAEGEQRPRTGSRDGPRPLWQQNRQLSRNLMWM